jgi:hypothetical protein
VSKCDADGNCVASQAVDCSFLNSPCGIGTCDPQLGCVAQPLNDGDSCNDAQFCTINDTCQSGVCQGDPNPCVAPGDTCQIASCNEALDTCTSVPGNNGGACDDQNACTAGETCSNGLCGGGAPANNGGACDDHNACTTNDVCAGGSCAGAPVVACVNGDGCCPPGCVLATDDDCGGMVYMTSSNGSTGFVGYDVNTNAWKILPEPPVVTYSQLTTDGTYVFLLGSNNVIYKFDPSNAGWTIHQDGPGGEAAQPIGFFKWTPKGFYYAKDGASTLKQSTANGWTTLALPISVSSAGSYDAVTQNLYIRGWFNLALVVFSTTTNTVVNNWSNPTNCGENSRTGSYYNGYFYERDWSATFQKVNVATGVATDTGILPSEGHTASDVDPSSGKIYIGPYTPTGTAFQVYDTVNGTLNTLQPSPINVSNHSTVVFVR